MNRSLIGTTTKLRTRPTQFQFYRLSQEEKARKAEKSLRQRVRNSALSFGLLFVRPIIRFIYHSRQLVAEKAMSLSERCITVTSNFFLFMRWQNEN